MINIVNGTDVVVMVTIHRASVSFGPSFGGLDQKPKVFIIGYAHNTTQTRDRKISLGYRQQGDELIGFESKNVTLKKRFAEHEFLFNAPNKFITSVGFSFSVSAISFSFFVFLILPLDNCAFATVRFT